MAEAGETRPLARLTLEAQDTGLAHEQNICLHPRWGNKSRDTPHPRVGMGAQG